MRATLYTALRAAGVPISHYASDLQFPLTPASRPILAAFKRRGSDSGCPLHTSGCDLSPGWVQVLFAYDPHWESRTGC